MMSDNIAGKHVEQSRNNRITNCPTQLYLVGHFYKICIMMHGSKNVKLALPCRRETKNPKRNKIDMNYI